MGRAWTALCIIGLAVIAATLVAAEAVPPATASASSTSSALPAASSIDFNRDVVPILSANCFKCHGPDSAERKSGLRLDHRDTATKSAESGEVAIVPSKPDKSELVRRIFADDPDERMPPPDSKKELTEAQKQTLRAWIAAGAEYEPHWSFVVPKQAPLPKVKQADWPKNAIDNFILARLEAEGLRPSPEADRYTLIRRVSLDLIGLPPTPEEADAFVHDTAPDAYERLVDRLLASPHYGERWARRWLDLARYADTNGYEKDRPRTMWPYRDWVIQALNADMPFDQFTVEQLAGDLLPHPTVEQQIATGFHRNTMLNEEGGIDALEYRFHAIVDRVNTTGTTWLGMTVGCAQCHTHKFDPITQTEYYRLMAFLNNADEPEMEVPSPDVAKRRAEIEARIARLTAKLPDEFPVTTKGKSGSTPATNSSSRRGLAPFAESAEQKVPVPLPAAKAAKSGDESKPDHGKPAQVRRPEALARALAAWQKRESAQAVNWTVLRPARMKSNLPILTLLNDDSVLASGDITKSDTYELTFDNPPAGITAVRLEALPHESLPKHGPGLLYYEGPAGDFFLSEISLAADGHAEKFAAAVASSAPKGTPVQGAIDGNPQTGWSVNGTQGQPSYAVFSLAQPTGKARALTIRMLFERFYAAALGHFRISVTTDPRAAKPTSALPPAIETALAVPAEKRTAAQRDQLFQYYLSVAPELAAARKEIDKLRESLPSPPTTLVMRERPAGHTRPTQLHHRGEFLQPREEVTPGVPEFLPPLPAGVSPNRLTLARWLVSRDNPLTARVTVNRQWGNFFGRGIVRTTADFGYQGEPPSHPEMLDWLAVDFMNRGWSLKQLHRLIVTSATYRQSSRVTPDLLAKDPQNVLLSRGPRFRLEAEMVRDAALRDAGLLSSKIGGPSVFPPQPPSVSTEGTYAGGQWDVSTGEDRYRRSLYTFAKRSAPFAMYNAFDAPSGEVCVARREISNSPLQALMLLNDTVFLDAAQALGKTSAAGEGSDATRAAAIFRRCLTRPPEQDEVKMLVDFAHRERERFAKEKANAAKIAGGKEENVVERATWTAVARAVLNLDETITKN